MKYGYKLFLNDNHGVLPLSSCDGMTVSELAGYLSKLIRVQLYKKKKFLCIHIFGSESTSDSMSNSLNFNEDV